MSIEYVHGDSVVHNLTPYSKFLYMVFIMIASYILWDIVSVAIYLAISLVIWQLAGIPDILTRFKFIRGLNPNNSPVLLLRYCYTGYIFIFLANLDNLILFVIT